jgi:hypothetical protein
VAREDTLLTLLSWWWWWLLFYNVLRQVEVRVRTAAGGLVSLQELSFATPAVRPSPPHVLHAAVVLAASSSSGRSRGSGHGVTGLCVVKACVGGPLNDLVATLHASATRVRAQNPASQGRQQEEEEEDLEEEAARSVVVAKASAVVRRSGEAVDLLLHGLPAGHTFLVQVQNFFTRASPCHKHCTLSCPGVACLPLKNAAICERTF